ncbi:hydroxyethylthiazole kinase [Spirulina sp. CS-785/01]|uniref:hydroxyethylthiazole kinase n=1 Tax=Spirulina sp. CS-785/01 TaxID=3021716 RepID=UPI00232F186D|nr:hydroxyethylthiazole kinase [Spirulina sp. CS-785/01]MDB9312464.1 hydroxyethylthiazole kinase [Spirulina sp. CS-785/01]
MTLDTNSIWQDLQGVRQSVPLVHNITNYVVMNSTANALLAIGASPIMAHAVAEMEEMVSLASALVVNIGTLSDRWIEAMEKAMQQANAIQTPIVLDPVGAGATRYRTETLQHLLQQATPTVIRGNASEIGAVAASSCSTKGVDSTTSSDTMITVAQDLSTTQNCTVVVTGATDYIIQGDQVLQCKNGHPLMAKVTGMGCTATALIGAFLAVNNHPTLAAAHAIAVIGIAGEIAAETAKGPGSLQVHLLDALYNLDGEQIARRFWED